MKSLHTKILVFLLGSVFVTAALMGGIAICHTGLVVDKDSSQIMNLLCGEKIQEIDRLLHEVEQAVEMSYDYADSQLDEDKWNDAGYMEKYMKKVKPVLENAAFHVDSAATVYLRFNPELDIYGPGIFLVREQGTGSFVETEPTDLTLYEPEDRNYVGWYYEPIENGGPMWMDPYVNEKTGMHLISYGIPIFRADKVVGVIGMEVGISYIKELVGQISVYDTGYAFLVSSNGDVIYHKSFPNGISVGDFDEDLLQVNQLMSKSKDEGEIFSYRWHGEKKKLALGRMLNGMYLVITASVSEIDAIKNKLFLQCLVTLAIVLVIMAVPGAWLTGRITRPLMELTRSARKIADGDSDVVIQCDTKDEVGVLADTLSKVLDKQNQYISYVGRLAYADTLTDVMNKQAYNEKIQGLDVEIRRKTASFSIIVLDISNLKQISDTYGRGKEDGFIIAAANLMKKVFGTYSIYRICDDEFVVLLSGESEEKAEKMQEKFDNELSDFNRERNSSPEELMIAAGVAGYDPVRDISFADVYSRADKKLYRNKTMLNAKRGMLDDALKMLQMVFHKILKVNLTEDHYFEIKVYEAERDPRKGYSPRLSEWLEQFAVAGQVHPKDRDEFLAFTNIVNMRQRLKYGETYQSCRYRRKVKDEFRWVKMEIVTSVEYSDEEQIILLYVRDIHDSYKAELDYQKELERLNNTDSLTGLYNRSYMTKYCQDYVSGSKKDVGIVFCDINGLKYANDHYGHAAGDKLIMTFAKIMKNNFPHDMCCRMSGDEFVICVMQVSEEKFMHQVEKLKRNSINEHTRVPLASIGGYWMKNAENIGSLLNEAENVMYQDKAKFYEKFPEYRR